MPRRGTSKIDVVATLASRVRRFVDKLSVSQLVILFLPMLHIRDIAITLQALFGQLRAKSISRWNSAICFFANFSVEGPTVN